QGAERERGISCKRADALEEDEHPGRHAGDEPDVEAARESRGCGDARLPFGHAGDLEARGVPAADPRGESSDGQAREVADLRVRAERRGRAAPTEEEQ